MHRSSRPILQNAVFDLHYIPISTQNAHLDPFFCTMWEEMTDHRVYGQTQELVL